MPKPNLPQFIIIEPRAKLAHVYNYLPTPANIIHFRSTQKAIKFLKTKPTPDLVIISASFSPGLTLKLLEVLKLSSKKILIPLLIMINLGHKINLVLGTYWGGKIGIICSLSSRKEVEAVLKRIEVENKSFGY